MRELIRSNDLVFISYVEVLLSGADIPHDVADAHMSAVVGSIDASPRRILVSDADWSKAKEIVDAAATERPGDSA